MITPETREELKRISNELKKVFPASKHEIRELPGTDRKWVYLRWQTIRDRLDEVCPDWVVDYSEIQYLGNDAICRCGITILGIRKEALASVPLSILSGKGKEMTRGSAADRLAAEALKNASETWGVGRYLDEQEFTIRYLWENMGELDGTMQGEIRRLSEQYKIDKGARTPHGWTKNETGFLRNPNNSELITEGQRKRLWAIAKTELKLSDEQIKNTCKHLGFEKTEMILKKEYETVIERLRSAAIPIASAKTEIPKPADLYPANNDVVRQIRALTKHEPAWIFAQCRHHGYDRPGMMPPEILEKLITDMCADWALDTGVVSSRDQAATSLQGAIAFANGAGSSMLGAVLEWLRRHTPATVSA